MPNARHAQNLDSPEKGAIFHIMRYFCTILATASLFLSTCSGGEEPQRLLKKGEEALQLGKLKAARRYFEQALKNGGGTAAHKGLALTALRRGDIRSALSREARIREEDDSSVRGMNARAVILERAGRVTEAATLYTRVLSSSPDNPQALYGRARYCIYTGDREKAHNLLTRLLDSTADEKLKKRAQLLLGKLR